MLSSATCSPPLPIRSYLFTIVATAPSLPLAPLIVATAPPVCWQGSLAVCWQGSLAGVGRAGYLAGRLNNYLPPPANLYSMQRLPNSGGVGRWVGGAAAAAKKSQICGFSGSRLAYSQRGAGGSQVHTSQGAARD